MRQEKLVPELRFPEFEKEWDIKRIQELAEIYLGLTYTPEYVDEGIPFLSVKDINRDGIDINKIKYISKKEFKNSTDNAKPKKGDILFGRVGTLGNPIIIKESIDFAIFVSLGYLRVNEKKANPKYIKYWMESNEFKKQIYSIVAGSSQRNLNTTWFKKFQIKIPRIKEQEKIGNLFSKLDKKIELQKELIENLEKQKKGFMQRSFNQEIRFKDENGEDYPKWKEERIKNKGGFYNGLRGKNKNHFSNGNKKYIQYLNIFKNTILDNNLKNYDYVLIKEDENQNQVKYGDLLFTQSSETLEEIGMTAVYLGNEEIYLNSFSFGFRFKDKDSINYKYIAYLFESETMRRKIIKEGQGSTRINLSSNRLKNIKIQLPITEEQNKIANFLSLADKRIDLEKEQLENYRKYKKGLMQRMFI